MGAVTIACCALMAWHGVGSRFFIDTPLYCCAYWAVFLLLLAITLFIAFLDMRYIRLLYAVEKREMYSHTLGDEEFRTNLISAQQDRQPEDE